MNIKNDNSMKWISKKISAPTISMKLDVCGVCSKMKVTAGFCRNESSKSVISGMYNFYAPDITDFVSNPLCPTINSTVS